MVEGSSEWLPEEQAPAFIDDVSAGKSLNCMELESLLRFSQMNLHSASQYKWILPKKPKSVSKQRRGKPFSGQVSHLISTRQSVLSVTEGKETNKKAAAEVGCSKGLAERLQGGHGILDSWLYL